LILQTPEKCAVDLAETLDVARKNYCRCLKRCRKRISDKSVHKLRVETRRLLAWLDFSELARLGCSPEKIRKNLKNGLDAFDDVRDTHVELQLLKPLWPDFPEAKPFKKFLKRHEQKLIKCAQKKLSGASIRKISRQLKDLEKEICNAARSTASVESAAADALRMSFAQVATLRRNIRGRDVAAIHKMRVAFKRFRYMSELLQPFLPWVTDEQINRMRKFQSAAGDVQDLEILLGRIQKLIRKKKFTADCVRSLQTEIARRKKRALDFFLNRADDLFKFQPPPKIRARPIRVVL
jgi:CHAD domain-containing protein